MAEMEIDIDLGPIVRDALIRGLADVATACPQLTMAVVLRILRDDEILRCMIAEELGEAAIREHQADMEAARIYEANKGEGCEPPAERSWDDLMVDCLDRLLDTPGGRGEVR